MAARVRHVALDALWLDPGRSGGPETYLRQLAPALAAAFPQTRFTVMTTRRGAEALRGDGWEDFASVTALPADEGQRVRRTLAEQALVPALAAVRRVDVVHGLASTAPMVLPGLASVVTLHDTTFFRMATFNRVTTWGMKAIVARAARRADALIADSGAARDDTCATLGLDPARFTVVPLGPGRPPDVEPTGEAELRERYRLDGRRLVLCVAAKRPHKNQELLVRAAGALPGDVAIVLVGHPEPYEERLRALIGELGVGDRVRLEGYVPDADLEGLWRLARCAAFPTLAEGFGLPVLEAMLRGRAVACSDIPVLREVGGDVPFYFDPRDPGAAAQAITAATGDGGERTEAARRRAATFSWQRAAEGTFAAYERALAARRG
ncbi:MAG TPA: glycosyltransferase family 1 protein [Solirubrobacteraceae bacterium]